MKQKKPKHIIIEVYKVEDMFDIINGQPVFKQAPNTSYQIMNEINIGGDIFLKP